MDQFCDRMRVGTVACIMRCLKIFVYTVTEDSAVDKQYKLKDCL